VEYEDRIAIPTPEGIELEYTLAGLASRFIALLVDLLLRAAVLGALTAVVYGVLDNWIGGLVVIAAAFLALFAYDIGFEVWGGGRTPGKRWSGLRVVMDSGRPIGFVASAVRNLLRLLDGPPTLFVVGAVTILATKRNQRLGDLAAGTIVVRERHARATGTPFEIRTASTIGGVEGVDVTAVSAVELAAIRDFLARRDGLTPEARARVSKRLADRLEPKVGGLPPGGLAPEQMLETIAAAKATVRLS
jgi:uncharacterized RDD family membrane protein YckC